MRTEPFKRPKGPSREDMAKWKRLHGIVMAANFDTISEPNTFPLLLICYDTKVGADMRSFGGVDVRFVEWKDWLLPVGIGVGPGLVAVYAIDV
jgi:hypothetical protein